MNAPASAAAAAAPESGGDWRAQARRLWKARTRSERRALTLLAVVIVLFLGWLMLVQPALRVARDAPAQIDRLEAELQQVQRLAAEAASLRDTSALAAGQATAALRGATERLGDKGKLTLQGDRATLSLTGVPAEALRAWLVEARAAARTRPVEAQLTRTAQGYSGTVVLQFGSAP